MKTTDEDIAEGFNMTIQCLQSVRATAIKQSGDIDRVVSVLAKITDLLLSYGARIESLERMHAPPAVPPSARA